LAVDLPIHREQPKAAGSQRLANPEQIEAEGEQSLPLSRILDVSLERGFPD